MRPATMNPALVGTAFARERDLTAMATIYGGMPIVGCLPGSPADKAGLRRGDIVLSVNGVATPDADAFVRARGRWRQGAVVRVVRDHTEFEIELAW